MKQHPQEPTTEDSGDAVSSQWLEFGERQGRTVKPCRKKEEVLLGIRISDTSCQRLIDNVTKNLTKTAGRCLCYLSPSQLLTPTQRSVTAL